MLTGFPVPDMSLSDPETGFPLTFLPCDVTKIHERSDLIADLMVLSPSDS